MAFPATRLRRLRKTAVLRALVRETTLGPSHLIYPMFVVHGSDTRTPIASMPGIDHLSIGHAVEEAGEAAALGVAGVMLFGLPASKDEQGSGAWDEEGVVQLATRAIKAAHPDLFVVTDVCLCEYTSHGHCGVLRSDGVVDNDQTLELLARTAVAQVLAGADALAPSDMMDGRVGALRAALDEENLTETPIIAHSAKYASTAGSKSSCPSSQRAFSSALIGPSHALCNTVTIIRSVATYSSGNVIARSRISGASRRTARRPSSSSRPSR